MAKKAKKKSLKKQGVWRRLSFVKARDKKKAEAERQKEMAKRPSFNTPIAKYQFTPSYMKLGNRYGSLIKLVNVAGMNSDKEFSWAVDLLPNIDLAGVKGYFIGKDSVISEKAERTLQEKEINELEKAVANNGVSSVSSEKEKRTRLDNLQDIMEVKSHLDEKEHIVDAELILLITADSADKISEQITRLQRFYDRHINGILLKSVGGDQEQAFKDLFERPKSTRFNYTFTTRTFAGVDHMIRKGIDDKTGWGIGMIADSYSSGVAMMDFDKSFDISSPRLKGQVLIAASPTSSIRGYEQFKDMSAPSAWGQLIANQAMTNLPKPRHVFHIVMNGFDYCQSLEKGEDKFVVPPHYFMPDVEYHDAYYGGINPIEGFGESSRAGIIYNQKIATLARIFYLLSDRELSKGAVTTLERTLQEFYSQGLWDEQAMEKGKGHMARFMNMEDHTDVSTLGDFAKKMINTVQRSSGETATEKEKDEVLDLFKTLEVALKAHPEIYNTYTTLPNRVDSSKLQHYYDLSKLASEQKALEVQFLNFFPYVLASAKENDIVVIHGMDKLTLETWRFVKDRFMSLARERQIRFVYIFDTIGSESIKSEEDKEILSKYPKMDIFNSRGTLYTNLNADFDVTILGMMTNEELDLYEKLVTGKGGLPANIRSSLSSLANSNFSKFQVRRPADTSNNTVMARFGI